MTLSGFLARTCCEVLFINSQLLRRAPRWNPKPNTLNGKDRQMARIKSFDRPSIRFLQAAVSDALKKVGEAFGVEFKVGGGRFSPTRFACRLDVTIAGAEPQEAQDFRQYADVFGLKPGDLGRAFLDRGRRFTIVGLLPRSRSYPSWLRTTAEPCASRKLRPEPAG